MDRPPTPVFVEDRIRFAYTLLEAARIRCEQLAELETDAGADAGAIHRDLGLAGYYCSSEMPRQIRQGCLSKAHELSDLGVADELLLKLRKAFDEALTACDAISRVLAEAPSDYAHIAHVHVMSALESLDSWLATASG